MTLPEVGSILRTARKNRRLTQGQLAGSLGMSRATLSAIENGTVGEIGVRKLMALSTALGLELSIGPRRSRPTLDELREELRGEVPGP